MSWQHGGEPDEPGEYVVVMGSTKFLMTWNARDRRWFDGYIRREPGMVKAYWRVPIYTTGRERVG